MHTYKPPRSRAIILEVEQDRPRPPRSRVSILEAEQARPRRLRSRVIILEAEQAKPKPPRSRVSIPEAEQAMPRPRLRVTGTDSELLFLKFSRPGCPGPDSELRVPTQGYYF